MRTGSRRHARSLFVAYLCVMSFAAFMAVPLARSLEPVAQEKQARARAAASASVGSSSASAGPSAIRYPSFEDCDRNGDGVLDKSEAGSVPGLSANFERADQNKDGKLDRDEFDKAIALLDSQRK